MVLAEPQVDTLEDFALDTLEPFDTIIVQTQNSMYRIFLLDPTTGRSLIEGGHLLDPIDALVIGSVYNGSTLIVGQIGIGMSLQFWSHGRLTTTSSIQSFHVETHDLL